MNRYIRITAFTAVICCVLILSMCDVFNDRSDVGDSRDFSGNGVVSGTPVTVSTSDARVHVYDDPAIDGTDQMIHLEYDTADPVGEAVAITFRLDLVETGGYYTEPELSGSLGSNLRCTLNPPGATTGGASYLSITERTERRVSGTFLFESGADSLQGSFSIDYAWARDDRRL